MDYIIIKMRGKTTNIKGNGMQKLTTNKIEKMWDEFTEKNISIFIRWSRGPEYDTNPSRDYQSGNIHSGLSAVKIGAWEGEYMERRLQEYRFLRMKDEKIMPYIYTGEEIGLDSDGYELIDVDAIECLGIWDEVK